MRGSFEVDEEEEASAEVVAGDVRVDALLGEFDDEDEDEEAEARRSFEASDRVEQHVHRITATIRQGVLIK